jgi:hypothetical protein
MALDHVDCLCLDLDHDGIVVVRLASVYDLEED